MTNTAKNYLIHETFQETIQGEGFWAGVVSDFIRLFGCPVRCPWCDTGYGDEIPPVCPVSMSREQIAGQLKSQHVVISGGEPMFQSGVGELISFLQSRGHHVAVETSGSAAIPEGLSPDLWVTLSPKEHVSSYSLDPGWWDRANEVKLVIASKGDFDFYEQKLKEVECPVFLQPEWSSRGDTIPLTIDLLKKFPIARLSIQQHKFLGLP